MATVRTRSAKQLKLPDKRPGPGRPPSIDQAHLLAVAREVFLERGIRATTLEVAERAGVSEGVLFHRFKSKEGLFGAAMNFDHEDAPRLLLDALKEVEELEVREGLVKLSTTLLEIGRVALPIMMMSWSNPALYESTPYDKKRAQFRVFLKAVGAYLERHMEAGKLRPIDAEVFARALIGALHHYSLNRLFMTQDETVIPEGMYVRGLVDLLLNGAVRSNDAVADRRGATQKSRSDAG